MLCYTIRNELSDKNTAFLKDDAMPREGTLFLHCIVSTTKTMHFELVPFY